MRYAKSLKLGPGIFSADCAMAPGVQTKQKRLLGGKQALSKCGLSFNRASC
jgi:hypothetical protein